MAEPEPLPEAETIHPQSPSANDDRSPTKESSERGSAQEQLLARGKDLTNVALHFLSTASNETLAGCGVALCASTYFLLGRVGLVLIGAVGGVILHATWDGATSITERAAMREESRKRQKEAGVEIAKRLLEWRESRARATTLDLDGDASTPLDYSKFQPQTGTALDTFTDAVIRDYVKYWYDPILPKDKTFPLACRKTLVSFILSFSNHVSRKRPADTFLEFLTNSSSIVIVFLNELSVATMSPEAVNQSPVDAVRRYLVEEPESSLANVLSVDQQEKKLTLVADDILQNFLDARSYGCEPVKVFLRQVLAGLILESTVVRCSKPEWINDWIVYLLEEGEPEFLEAIDAGVEGMKGLAKPSVEATQRVEPEPKKSEETNSLRASKAEEDMSEAMAEAKRLTDMIAEAEARRQEQTLASSETGESLSTVTTEGIATPTSTDSDRNGEQSLRSSVVLSQSGTGLDQPPSTPPHPLAPSETLLATTMSNPSIASGNTFSPTTADSPIAAVLTLHKASISIFDDAAPEDKTIFRSKPTIEYLLQIEPASSRFPGWMISRKYTDFEALHETLRRISVVSGVSGFADKHHTLPTWKGQTNHYLRQNLETYLKDALQFEQLAESERMKRFLDKDIGIAAAPASKNPFSFKGPAALENMGKGLVDVLGNAPKGLAGGGKAVLGGVQGVFGAVGVGGSKKPAPTPARSGKSASVTSLPRPTSFAARTSQDSIPNQIPSSEEVGPPLPQRHQSTDSISIEAKQRPGSMDVLPEELNLPPPPSSIEDDYDTSKALPSKSDPSSETKATGAVVETPQEMQSPTRASSDVKESSHKTKLTVRPITEEETQMAVELFFAIINQLYTLSSAWNIRLTLLSAAKSFLLRPGNPNLEAIRVLIQEPVIDANFSSDENIAANILKLRENTLPTEEELKMWPPEPSAEEKEKLRIKARRLLVERGMPQALTSVMGAAASGEALGRVFDCLQIEEVSRGLIFALLLQAVRAATQ